jgi:hypothetical protein
MARIDHYEFGRIVVDGRQETKDLILLPDRVVRNWWRRDGHALVLDDLVEVLDELPAHLVVGTGADGRMAPDPATVQQLQERGVIVEARCPPARPCAGSLSLTRHAPRPPSTSPANRQSGNWQLGPRIHAGIGHGSVGQLQGRSADPLPPEGYHRPRSAGQRVAMPRQIERIPVG